MSHADYNATAEVVPAQVAALDRRLTWALGALLLLLTVAVFHRVVGFELLTWDDDLHITDNEYYQPLSWGNLFHFWGYSYVFLYIPVSYWFFGAEVWLAELIGTNDPSVRLNPAVFHVGNLLLHLGCTLLVYRLFLRLVRHAPAAFLGALLFAIHPLQGEAVCWVSETRGTLATLFSLLALHRYLDYVGIDPQLGIFCDRPFMPTFRRRRDYVWATIYFALALLSKPSATAWPLVVGVIDVLLLRQPWRDSLRRLALWLVMAAGIMGLTKFYQKTELVHAPSVPALSVRPFVAGDAYAFYLRKLVWPGETSFDYGRTPAKAAQSPWFYAMWIVPTAVGLALAFDRRRRRVLLGGYLIFLVALAPVSGIVPFLFQSISTVADRYAYVPLIGLGLTLAGWIASQRRGEGAFIFVALLLGLAAPITFRQTELWRDDPTVYGQGLKVNPRSFMAHLHLGNLDRKARRFDFAIEHYQEVLRIRYDFLLARYYIGLSYFEAGRYDEAIATYLQVLGADAKHYEALCGLGQSLVKCARAAEADPYYRRAIEADPKRQEAPLLLAELFFEQGRPADGERAFREALELNDSADAHFRYGRALLKAERYQDAIGQLEQAIALKPDLLAARYELATAYLRNGNFVPAIVAAEETLRQRPDDFGTLQTLGLALAAVGKNAEAATRLKAALELVPPASPQAAAVRATLSELPSY